MNGKNEDIQKLPACSITGANKRMLCWVEKDRTAADKERQKCVGSTDCISSVRVQLPRKIEAIVVKSDVRPPVNKVRLAFPAAPIAFTSVT